MMSVTMSATQIFVKTPPTNSTLILNVESSYTILQVKGMIQAEKGFPVAQQKLTYASTELQDDRTLGSYNIQKESTLWLEIIAATTNYYLVGTMNDWGASKQFQLTQNPENTAEYMITLNLKAGTQLKVIGVIGETTTWYPGDGDNYGKAGQIDADGMYTILISRIPCGVEI